MNYSVWMERTNRVVIDLNTLANTIAILSGDINRMALNKENSLVANISKIKNLGGKLSQISCDIQLLDFALEDATKAYSCNVGTLNGTKCDIKNVNGTTPVYTCKYGTLNSNTNKCIVTTTDSKNPIYYCKSGYTLADKKCYITEDASDIVNATPVYDTKTDTVYTWSTKTSLTGWTRTGKTRVREVAITSRF